MENRTVVRLPGSLLVSVTILLLLAASILLLAVSFVPFERVKPLADHATASGKAGFVAADILAGAVRRVRILSLGLLVATLSLYALRRTIGKQVESLLVDLRQSAVELREKAKEWAGTLNFPAVGIPVLLTLAAAAVRVAALDRPVLWDEATTFLQYVSRPFWLIVAWYSEPNNHVLYSLMASASCWLFGNSLWALRLPALLAGILVVPVSYWLGRKLYGSAAALLTGCLMAVAPPMVMFSVNGRGYSLLVLLFLLLLGLAGYLKEQNNLTLWLVFAVLIALGLYTLPVMAYPLSLVLTWLAMSVAGGDSKVAPRPLARRCGTALLLGALLTAVLYAPALLVSGPEALLANRYVVPKPWAEFASLLPVRLAQSWDAWNLNVPPPLQWVLAAGFLAALLLHRRIASHRVPVAGGLLAVAALIVLQRLAPEPRVLVFLFPCYVLIASAGIAYLCGLRGSPRALGRKDLLAGLLGLAMAFWWGQHAFNARFLFDPAMERESLPHGEEVAAYLQHELNPGDRVLFAFPSGNSVRFYFRIRKLGQYIEPQERANRLFVIVNDLRPGYTVEDILREKGYAPDVHDPPAKVLDLDLADVYRVLLR